MKIIIFYLILLFPSAFYAQEVPKLRIDPSKAYGGNVSDYFDSVEYIPLETTKESLFGDVGKLIITDSSYVIKDNDTKCILFFLLNGKFIKKIKMNENSDYAVFYEKSENQLAIYKKIFTSPDFSVQYYSLQGNPLPVKTRNSGLINDERIPIGRDYWIKFSSCYYLPRTAAKDTNIFLLQIYKNNQVAKSFLPFNPKNNLAFCALAYGNLRFSNIYDETAFYVSIPLEHTVYKVNKDTAVKLFQFIFPSDRSINKHILESKDEKYIDSLRGAKWHNV